MRGERFAAGCHAIWHVPRALTTSQESSVYGFSDWPYLISPWTTSRKQVVMDMSFVEPVRAGGLTALNATIHDALDGLDGALGRRRAVLVISDGNDELPGDRTYRGDVETRNLSADARLCAAIDFVTRAEGIVYAVGIEGDPKHQLWLDDHALRAVTMPTGGFTTF